nr:PKD domain-containing protein [uncultured Methanobacterium sp.]
MPYGSAILKGYGKSSLGSLTPNFSVNVEEGDAPLLVNFTNLTEGNNEYTWDFGDGYISKEENPSHTFNSGIYTVVLIAKRGGSVGYVSKTNIILALPASSPTNTISPYTGVTGGYGIGQDPISNLNVAYTQATSGVNEGRLKRAITSITGRWDFNFRLMNNYPQFVQYCFLSTSSSNPFPCYAIVADGANSIFKLVKINSGGTDTTLLSTPFTNVLGVHTMSVTRNSSGVFEFIVDGTSIGTVTDTTYTSFTYDWIREWSGSGTSQALYNWIKKDNTYVQNWNGGLSNIRKLYSTPILREPGKNMGHPRLIEIDNELRLYYQKHGGVGICYAVMNKDLGKWEFTNDGNPVFNWEDAGVPSGSTGMRMGNILKVGDLYYLYYGSEPASNIYLATSTDGINFTPHPSNPVATPDGGSEPMMGLPFVIKVNDTFYMYYLNFNGVYTQPYQYRVASSSDGLSWTKHGIIVEKGSSGAWDSTLLEDKSVFYDGTHFYLLYEGFNGTSWCAGLAKSSNPLGPFTKSPSPILSGSGISGAYDQYHIATPYVYQSGEKLFLIYQGGNSQDYNISEFSFMLATIDDLSTL